MTGKLPDPESEAHTATEEGEQVPVLEEDEKRHKDGQNSPSKRKAPKSSRPSMAHRASTYSKPTYPKPTEQKSPELHASELEHSRSIINPVEDVDDVEGNAGFGRLVEFSQPQPLTSLIERIAHGVGSPKGFPVAIPQTKQVEDIMIKKVGVCAGSGHSVLQNCDADLLFTGELSHHEVLRATEQGRSVITLFHSNSERGYLSSVMKQSLTRVLKEEWQKVRKEVKEELEGNTESESGWEEALDDEDVLVEVSERDRDPFGVVILQSDQQGKPLR